MHINRGLLFWGVALITAGAVALAVSQDLFDPSALAGAWRLWPVVLIAIGLAIVLSRTPFAAVGTLAAALVVGAAGGLVISIGPGFGDCNGGQPGSPKTSGGVFSETQATVDLELTCGSLVLSMASGNAWQADTSIDQGQQPSLEADAGSLEMRSGGRGLPFDRDRQAWAVTLGNEPTYLLTATLNAVDAAIDGSGGSFERLALTPNASSVHLALAGAQVADLDLQLNAGSLSIDADAESDLAGQLDANAGSITLCVPDGAGLLITVGSSVAFSHNLDDSSLTKSGDTFTSDGFDSAAHKIVLRVHGNAASFEMNPEEGCA
jgi:hypothetical protein